MDQRAADWDEELAIAGAMTEDAKKPYLRPQLVRLGSLAEMTRTVGYRGAADGGRFPQRFRTGTF